MSEPALRSQSRDVIQKGSKSFALASFFFNEEHRYGAWLLYSWCRFCDDAVDSVRGEEQRRALLKLEENTRACFLGLGPTDHPWAGFQLLVRKYDVPQLYALDLLRGMRMDVEGFVYRTRAELLDYCYCVAGTVGLM
ncbi:MAG: squalene/phytoene synthase family protein, partial [Bdellovibrionaceae bacterium]|nr:squalene/phytoene synthase family protein [Pseudobdellovibrionaceae bacterium]